MVNTSYEWNIAKARSNQRKHGIDFADLEQVFEDESAITLPDADHEEERYIIMGMDARGRLVVVVHTWRGDPVRIISARRATRKERREYEGDR